ncbi:angiotensin-converting enzyme-like [Acanthaster planci]|uniref:Angiotensin-converting enzyme n=1 Tax=Acanthaster planci TaxID=133434 RepID=A0A8B7XWD5_ACAPL|nr:angiotensin-converting enzyme-like [Acanthaster planci]XP_022084563.1 angiotensin-converting enzyme-like [Acanthaster planci]XP_022084564.1 angiotensin-converting enzyme-like [Acanthaster planci]XP_022084566.1 angiotensin-converting enzyme-like [Acanthaster planci]XP_022084567.1 angiotensin-converting enzyme-like [Acanthaster planci]
MGLPRPSFALVALVLALVSLEGAGAKFSPTSAMLELEIIKEHSPSLLRNLCCEDRDQIYDCIIRAWGSIGGGIHECCSYLRGEQITNEELAAAWLRELDYLSVETAYAGSNFNWNFQTNMTAQNSLYTKNSTMLIGDFSLEMKNQARQFDTSMFQDPSIKRQFMLLLRGGYLNDRAKRENMTRIANEMENIYGKGTVCRENGECLTLEPDLEDLMANKRDYDELLWAWKGWRDAVGRKIRPLYPQYVELKNEGARTNSYADESEVWQERYEMRGDAFEEMLGDIYDAVKPMYQQLHAYVRRKLAERYGKDKVDTNGLIPAHLLGNMWGQQWNNIYDLVIPYPDVPDLDVTQEMRRQGYTVHKMFKVAERFFKSLGMDPMPDSFWENSMLEKPKDREVVCHGSAHNFFKNREVRIKMCTEITMEDLYTVHHEMGHCEYYLQYHRQPVVFSSGANPGFHEAVGDTIALSVVTQDYLHEIGLLDKVSRNKEADINYLMKVALSKIAFLPFGLMIDKWRWGVFRGEIKPESYNEAWWKLREEYQGLKPPVERTEEDFDPGAKYHIPSGTPYIRYFISFVIQFQFHRAMCEEKGHVGPLHLCNNYNSKRAGQKLRDMLSLGISVPWWEALEVLTGSEFIDPSAIQEYFAPLIEWLKEQNGDNVGWQKHL